MALPSIEAVTFDASEMKAMTEENTIQVHVWLTVENDILTLNYFPIAPDIPSNFKDMGLLQDGYRKMISSESALIEAEAVKVDGCQALWLILRKNLQPHGTIYLASLTIPFRDFSFVAKVQCDERGITGMRESMASADIAMKKDGLDERWNFRERWIDDIYDSRLHEGRLRNVSDDEKYDSKLPNHPLSRAPHVSSFTFDDRSGR
jgi:hypothetical protein